MIVLLLSMNWFSTAKTTTSAPQNRRPSHLPFKTPSRSTPTLSRRGVPGMPGDIEWMGFYGSLLAVPTMLSVLGIVTNYNLEKSYFNSQLNAEYYRQTREMLRAHTAKLIKEQEEKFAKQGTTWKGMVYDQDGNVRTGVRAHSWGGRVLGVEDEPKKGGNGAGGGAPASEQAGAGQEGGAIGANSQGATG
ncbi:hypothetical protein PHBOTO_001803 [Pseudozyma hubeiensis]|nr:hypothetical protein PHBOTO_001803 [Pseudozyma hubeiensis]